MTDQKEWEEREKWIVNEAEERLCMACASVIRHGDAIGWVHGTICHKKCADEYNR